MNWIDELNKIYWILEEKNLLKIKENIQDAQLSGGTGGEILMLVCDALIKIRREQPDIYVYIEKEADKLIVYEKEIGY